MLRIFQFYTLLMPLFFIISCNSQHQQKANVDEKSTFSDNPLRQVNKLTDFDKAVYCGLLDSKGILWFGTIGNGLYSYDGITFTHYTEEEGLNNNTVISIIEDNDGILWLGTADGLSSYDRKTFTHVPIPFSDTTSVWLDKVYPVINPNAVHSLLQDSKGFIWIGTGGAGAYRYDLSAELSGGKKFTSFLTETGIKQEDGLYHNWITSIIEDDNGEIWFSSMTRGGLNKFNGEKFISFMPKDGLFTDMVRTVFKDKSGKIWLGYKATHDGGLTQYDGESFINYDKKDGLCNHSIRVMYEDRKGNLWLGGDLNNLCIYNPSAEHAGGKSFKEFRSKEGKAFEGIFAIVEDADGIIWFGGKYGLWRFDGTTVTDMIQRDN